MAILTPRDWGSTPHDRRKHLEEICAICPHQRVMHGDAIRPASMYGEVEFHPGACNGCRCKAFMHDAPLSRDDVLDAHTWLEGVRNLEDLIG